MSGAVDQNWALNMILGDAFKHLALPRFSEQDFANIAKWELARQITPRSLLPDYDVQCTLDALPPNLCHLLDSPEGWVTLAGYVSAGLNLSPAPYRPTVH